MEYGRITVIRFIVTYIMRHLTNITPSYDISISNQLQNSVYSNLKFIMLKMVSNGSK